MFKRIKTLIKAKFYATKEIATEKVDTLYSIDKLTTDEYKEALDLIEKTYNTKETN